MGQPVFVAGQLRRFLRQISNAALPQTDIDICLPCQITPDRLRLGHDRHLVGIPPLLPDPAPVAAGLFGSDAAFFQQGHRMPVTRKKESGADPDDPAANHNDIRGRRGRAGIGDGGGGINRERLHGQALYCVGVAGEASLGRGPAPGAAGRPLPRDLVPFGRRGPLRWVISTVQAGRA